MRHRFCRLPALITAAASVVCASAAAAQRRTDDQIERPMVQSLEITGVRSVDRGELLESLATEESGCRSLLLTPFCLVSKSPNFYDRRYLDPVEFKRDVLRIKVFYWRRGYRATEVDTSVVRSGDREVKVRFTVREGPPTTITALAVRGDTVLRPRQRRNLMLVRRGRPLDLPALDSTLVRLRGAFAARGYASARVTQRTTVDDSAHQATVLISVATGPLVKIGRVEIEGNREIEDRTIRNSLTFSEGDVYRADEVAESQRTLYESGLFRSASIDALRSGGTLTGRNSVGPGADSLAALAPNDSAAAADSAAPPPAADSVRTIEIRVDEMSPREARLSGGVSTVDFFQVDGRLTNHNWFGNARRLDIQAGVGNILAEQLNGKDPFRNVLITREDPDADAFLSPTWQASADLRQRWFQNPRNTIGVGVFAHRRSSPSIFIDKGYGANATFTRLLAAGVPVSANYRFEITNVDAGSVFYCVSFGVCDQRTVSALQQPQRLSPLSLTSTFDRTNNPIGPTTGFRGRVELEHASAYTVSDFRYNRVYGELSYYRPVGRSVLAMRVGAGGVRALASTTEATGVRPDERDLGGEAGGAIIHPRRRFYAGGSQSVRGFGENQLGPRVLTIPANTLRGLTVTNGGRDTTYRGCDPSIPIQLCPVNATRTVDGKEVPLYNDDDFQPRPLGGNSVFEASVEYRFPVWGPLNGALFVDGAVVGAANLGQLSSATGAVTPGFGVRYLSPVGPVRVDVGINPRLAEELTVVTETDSLDAQGNRRIVELGENNKRRYNPSQGAGFRGFLRRFTIHLSIGEAF